MLYGGALSFMKGTGMKRQFLKGLLSSAMISAGILLGPMTASAADQQLEIHNNTGVTMEYFYASHVDMSDWGSDHLGNRVIESGYYETIELRDGTDYCEYDFRAEFEDGSFAEQYGMDVCAIDGLNFEHTTPSDAAATEPVSPGADRVVNIFNETGLTMTHFYSSSQDMANWGEDILGDEVLGSDTYLEVDFNDGSDACIYDFRAVFENDVAEIERLGLDICAMESFTFHQVDLLD